MISSDQPMTGMLVVIPSRLAVGETFTIKVKLRGQVREIPPAGAWNTPKPQLRGPFNFNAERRIQFRDDCLPQFAGRLIVSGGQDLQGPGEITFDGVNQGVFRGDKRPVGCFGGFRWTTGGFHFVSLTEPTSGLTVSSNPVYVSQSPPEERIYWGDPHWQTFFSDGVRCPEELYAFARDEAFLDFGAISDHMEAVTDRQWEYFQAVTEDYNAAGRFVTLIGQEWTNHDPSKGSPGHRNVYYRRGPGPALRSNSDGCDTLEKLWARLGEVRHLDPIAIPHHSASVRLGVNWAAGWNAEFEKAVEIYSVWGSSEKPAEAGNTRPIVAMQGEKAGQHVIDALKRGYRLAFVGGGDIHDGRPGDDLHNESYPPRDFHSWPQGFTACFSPALTRDCVYDAIKLGRTYATTKRRIYLDVQPDGARLHVAAAAEDGLASVIVVRNGEDVQCLSPADDDRVVDASSTQLELGNGDFAYVRVTTREGHIAWSSPVWGE